MTARIYKPEKSATQQGHARSQAWLLEFMPSEAREIEPLMGWTSSGDMNSQVRLKFATKEEAVAYAERNGLAYRIEDPKPTTRRVMAYADNFRAGRIAQWTH